MIGFLDSFDLLIQQWTASLGVPGEYVIRLLLALLAGGLVGLEREVRGREAGFRTNVLVCLGSCMAMLVSISFGVRSWDKPDGMNLNIDPSRIAYGVMTGVGFLGAGAIVHNKGSVRGLTTAAGLWCVASIGLACGFGLYVLTMVATFMVLCVLWILDYFEDWLPRLRYRTITVQRKWEAGCIGATVRRFESAKLHVVDAGFERSADLVCAIIHLKIAFTDKNQYYNFERELENDSVYQLLATQEL